MLCYINKNLKTLFTKQRLLSLLLVLNIVVSCLVICFSYGLYQNYNVIIEKGEEEEYTELSVLLNDNENLTYLYENEDHKHFRVCDIEPQMLIDLLKCLSDDTINNLQCLNVSMIIETPLAAFDGFDNNHLFDGTNNELYRDDAEPFYYVFDFNCSISDDLIVDAYSISDYFTDEQYNNGEKVAVVLDSLYNEEDTYMYSMGNPMISLVLRTLPQGTDYILIGGEKYKIAKKLSGYEMGTYQLLIPLTAVPKSAKIWSVNSDYENAVNCFYLDFKHPINKEQYEDINSCLKQVFGDRVYLESIKFTDATEIYYYKTIMLISVVIALLAAINMAILYRYILEKRSSELAIFRICGCSKGKAIFSYLLECMIINMPLFIITQICYHKLIMPKLTGLFPNMQGAYSLKLYAAIFGIYIGASTLIMLIMIASTIRGHSLVALKSAPKATSKFGIIKIFEIIQLAAVLSMLVMIISAITSRYLLYAPFEEYLSRKGYMVKSSTMAIYPDEFEELIGDADYIMSQYNNAYDGDIMFDGISYSDEFIKAYSPPMQEGVWLDEADFTHESSGFIPAVITSCGGRYHVGDVLESDILMNSEDPDSIINVKYKIIGVLKDKVSIASYILNNYNSNIYNDIYGVFSDSFETNDFLLTKTSDEYAAYNAYGTIYGIQFVFCEGMSDDEYTNIGRKLNGQQGVSATQLSEVHKNSLNYIYEQMYTLFPIAACIFILTIISTVSISAIYTKRQLRNYAIFYICGARWRTCALKSLKNGAITCAVSAALSALILIIGKATLLKETVISFGLWQLAVCGGVIILYLALSMIMPLTIIGSAEPREVLKEE